jgi:alpha-galactosidase
MLTGTVREIHVNTMNRGLISNLPEGSAIEVPASVDAGGVRPIAVGDIPSQGAALNRSYLSVAELTVEAALTGSRETVKRALLADPNASSTLTPERLWELCDAMFEAHAPLLPRSLGGAVDLWVP